MKVDPEWYAAVFCLDATFPQAIVISCLTLDRHCMDTFFRKDVDVDQFCDDPTSHPDQGAIDVE